MSSEPSLQVVVGATAAGKSAFAETLALQLQGEILNADSQQFYRGFDIGTGKVPARQCRVPHHFLDLCLPGHFITAGEFARLADALIQDLQQNNKIPVVVGGTGLYIRSLLEGLDPLPPRDEKVRQELRRRFSEEGGAALHAQLREVDPASAARINPQDEVRLVRYLEIHRLTGVAPSQLMRHQRPESLRYRVHLHWLKPPRELLRRQIAARVGAMLETGWVEEVRGLLRNGMDPRHLDNKPIGYSEIAAWLEAGGNLESVRDKIILRTQQYAKRQETFFKGLLAHRAYRENGNKLEILDSFGP